MSRRWPPVLLSVLLLIAAVLLAYWPACFAQFSAWDDRDQIPLNPDFNPPHLVVMLNYARGPYRGSLYPVSYWYLGALAAIDCVVRGGGHPLDAPLFHTASVLLHCMASLLVWLMLRRLRFDWPAALVGAMVFAVHPVQADAVAWASGFNTVLSGVFALAALWLYLPPNGPGKFPAAVRLSMATVFYALALAAKPSAVVVPVIAVTAEWAARRPLGRRTRLTLLLAWLIFAIPAMLITRHLQGAGGVTPTPLWTRPIVAVDAIAFYTAHVLFPVRLLVDYGRSPARLLAGGEWHYTWIVTAAMAAIVVLAIRRRWSTVMPAGIVLFVATLLPVLGLTPFNGQTMSTVQDRFLYLSMLGVAMLVACAWRAFRSAQVLIVVALIVLAIQTHVRAGQWHDDATLFAADLRGNPTSLPAHEVLGEAAAARGDNALAARHFLAALAVNPTDARIPFDLANALLRSGQAAAAIPYYQLAEADQARNVGVEPLDPRIFYNHGVADRVVGDLEGARVEFERALKVQPGFELARVALNRLSQPPERK